ncbi:MAG TPA: histidinol-phosphate transaminase [Clostridia bacterium]
MFNEKKLRQEQIMLLSKKAQQIKEYTAGEQLNEGYIKLNSNENPYPPSKKVLKAIKSSSKLNFYPSPRADNLRLELSKLYNIPQDNIFIGNGSDEVLGFAFLAFFNKHEKDIVFPEVTYSFYPVWAELYDINYRTIQQNDDFTINIKDYYNLQNCQGIIIANPNAPTTLELSCQDIENIVIHNLDKVIIIDEAYVDFGTYNCLDLVSKYQNVLVIRTFSKSWSLAGIRCGFAMGSTELIKGLEKIRDCFNSYSVNRLTQAAAIAAVSDIKYFNQTINKVKSTRTRVINELIKLGYNVLQSKTNFIFMTRQGWDAKSIYQKLKDQKILVRHFNLPKIQNYLRVTISTDEQMNKFLNALKKIDNSFDNL